MFFEYIQEFALISLCHVGNDEIDLCLERAFQHPVEKN